MAPYIRIVLRYGMGALAAIGWTNPELGDMLADDPDVLFIIEEGLRYAPLAIAAGVETWYEWAKRKGWLT